MTMEASVAIKLAGAAIDKGYKVHLFCYGEGVTAVKKGQTPKRFPNVSEELTQLVKKGLEISVCSTCSGARGITQEEMIDGALIGSLTTELAGYLGESDRVITLRR